MGAPLLPVGFRATDANGNPLSGAKLYLYRHNSLVPVDGYTTAELTTAHANPVVADSGGKFASIYPDDSITYRGILKTAGDVTVDDMDPLNGPGGRFTNLQAWGAVADCTAIGGGTDNVEAIGDLVTGLGDDGGAFSVPEGRYRASQRIDFTTSVRIAGEKVGQNPGVIDGVVYPTSAPNFLYGSTLVFDADTAGLYFIPHTDELNHDTVMDDIALNGNDSEYYEFPSSDRSVVEFINLFSSGSSDLEKHGIESRIRIAIRDTVVRGFAGDGYRLWGSTDGTYTPGGPPYGNIGKSQIDNARAVANKGDGFYIAGREGNVLLISGGDAISNTGWGFNDEGFLGNVYVACHAASNTAGSFRKTGTVAPTVYLGCYPEPGTGVLAELADPCNVIGGQLSSSNATAEDSDAVVWQGRALLRAPIHWTNTRGAVDIKLWMGGHDTTQTVLAFGADAALDGYKLIFDNTNSVWNLRYGGSTATTSLQLPFTSTAGLRTGANGGGFGIRLPGGFTFGGVGFGSGVLQHHNAGAAAPTSGPAVDGDVTWLTSVAAGGKIGKVVTTEGTYGSTAVTKDWGAIDA